MCKNTQNMLRKRKVDSLTSKLLNSKTKEKKSRNKPTTLRQNGKKTRWASLPSVLWSWVFQFLDTKTKICDLNQTNKKFGHILQKPETWYFTSIRNTSLTTKILSEGDASGKMRQFLKYATKVEVEIEHLPLDIDFCYLKTLSVNAPGEVETKLLQKMNQVLGRNTSLENLKLTFFPCSFDQIMLKTNELLFCNETPPKNIKLCTPYNILPCLQTLNLKFPSDVIFCDKTLFAIRTCCPFLKILKLSFINHEITSDGWKDLMNCAFLEEFTCKIGIKRVFNSPIFNLNVESLNVESLGGFPLIRRLKFLELDGFTSLNFLNIPLYQSSFPHGMTHKLRVLKLTVAPYSARERKNYKLPPRGLPDVQQLTWNFVSFERLNDDELQSIFSCCPKLKHLKVGRLPELVQRTSFTCFELSTFQTLTCTDSIAKFQLWEFLKKIRDLVDWRRKISWQCALNSTTMIHFKEQKFSKSEIEKISTVWSNLKQNKNQLSESCSVTKSLDLFNTVISQSLKYAPYRGNKIIRGSK